MRALTVWQAVSARRSSSSRRRASFCRFQERCCRYVPTKPPATVVSRKLMTSTRMSFVIGPSARLSLRALALNPVAGLVQAVREGDLVMRPLVEEVRQHEALAHGPLDEPRPDV